MLRLGFFYAYSGRDSILLHGEPNDIVFLLKRLRRFVDSPETRFPIHDFAVVARSQPAQLYAVRGRKSPLFISDLSEKKFLWDCTDDWDATQGMLENLISPSRTPNLRALPGFRGGWLGRDTVSVSISGASAG